MKKSDSFTPAWELFEQDCTNFLNDNVNIEGIYFKNKGGTISNQSDISVIKNNNEISNVEVKMPDSQACQIVVLIENEQFVYSNTSKSPNNIFIQSIIDYLNDNFEFYKNVSTSSMNIDFDTSTLYSRIIQYYQSNKNSPFIITGDLHTGFKAIFNCTQIDNFFDVKAVLRRKRSGTSDLPVKYRDNCIRIISEHLYSKGISITNTIAKGKKLYITLDKETPSQYIDYGDFSIYLALESGATYRVKKRSNTNKAQH